MGSLGKHLHIFLIRLVYLTALQDLQTYCAILIVGKEWTSTWLTDILHHTTYTHRSIQLITQIDDQLCILQIFDIGLSAAQILLNKTYNLFQFTMVVYTGFEHLEIFKGLLL